MMNLKRKNRRKRKNRQLRSKKKNRSLKRKKQRNNIKRYLKRIVQEEKRTILLKIRLMLIILIILNHKTMRNTLNFRQIKQLKNQNLILRQKKLKKSLKRSWRKLLRKNLPKR